LDELPAELVVELRSIFETVNSVLSQAYGPCVFFEHGARGPIHGGCGIYHAHVHAVPLGEVPDPVDALKLRFPYRELARMDDLRRDGQEFSAYLFYQDSNARIYRFDTGSLPSQYMRKLIADRQGNQDWDWRSAGCEERLFATIRRFLKQHESTKAR